MRSTPPLQTRMTNAQSNTNTIDTTATCVECDNTLSRECPRFYTVWGTDGDVTSVDSLMWWCRECMGEENGVPDEDGNRGVDIREVYTWNENGVSVTQWVPPHEGWGTFSDEE